MHTCVLFVLCQQSVIASHLLTMKIIRKYSSDNVTRPSNLEAEGYVIAVLMRISDTVCIFLNQSSTVVWKHKQAYVHTIELAYGRVGRCISSRFYPCLLDERKQSA